MRTERVGAVLVDGDHVTINWVFEMTGRDGKKRLLDEWRFRNGAATASSKSNSTTIPRNSSPYRKKVVI